MQAPEPIFPASPDRSVAQSESKRVGFRHQVHQAVSHISIAHKIRGGYGLALGVAALGTSLGLVLGNHYASIAKDRAQKAHQIGLLLKQRITVTRRYAELPRSRAIQGRFIRCL